VRFPGAVWPALVVVVCATACEAAPRAMDWRVRFEDPGVEARAVLIEARIVEGRCGDPAARVIYTALLEVDGSPAAPRPPLLGPGMYSIEAYARDARVCARCAVQSHRE
jgi:hypothetical protein